MTKSGASEHYQGHDSLVGRGEGRGVGGERERGVDVEGSVRGVRSVVRGVVRKCRVRLYCWVLYR